MGALSTATTVWAILKAVKKAVWTEGMYEYVKAQREKYHAKQKSDGYGGDKGGVGGDGADGDGMPDGGGA
jgi:hypothetical protein